MLFLFLFQLLTFYTVSLLQSWYPLRIYYYSKLLLRRNFYLLDKKVRKTPKHVFVFVTLFEEFKLSIFFINIWTMYFQFSSWLISLAFICCSKFLLWNSLWWLITLVTLLSSVLLSIWIALTKMLFSVHFHSFNTVNDLIMRVKIKQRSKSLVVLMLKLRSFISWRGYAIREAFGFLMG